MVYTYMLDEAPLEQRGNYRENLEHELQAPLEVAEREEYDREHWGLRPSQIREAERSEAMLAEMEEAEGVTNG